MENWKFFCGMNNRPLGLEVMKILEEYQAKIIPEFIDFNIWGDGCPNDKINNFEEIEDRKIILFDSLRTKESMFDFLNLSLALRQQYHASRLLAVIPFLLVRRCDHEEKLQEISYLRNYLRLLAFSGVTDLIVCTPHSDAMARNCQEFGINFSPAYMDFSRPLKTIVPKGERTIVFSPDKGSIPRAIANAKKISAPVMFSLKIRKSNNQTEIMSADQEEIEKVIKEYSQEFDFNLLSYIDPEKIKGANIILLDDEMSTGGTANMIAHMLLKMLAKAVYFAFTHPVCSGDWKITLFNEMPFTAVIAGNTIIRNAYNRTNNRIVDVSTAEVIATAIYQQIQ